MGWILRCNRNRLASATHLLISDNNGLYQETISNKMKNHAFLILAHKQPGLLSRIVSVLKAPNHYFFIHVDAKCDGFQRFRDAINRMGGWAMPSSSIASPATIAE